AALDGAESAGYEDADRREQGEPVAEGEPDLEPILWLGDDAVVGDQHERRETDDCGHFAAGPGEGVAANDDPGQDEGRGRRREQEPASDRERVPAAAAGVPDPTGPVRGIAAALDDTRVGREREPLEEDADHEQDR